MTYIKTITYGDNIEIYQYDHKPPPHIVGKKRKEKIEPDEERKFEKRKDNAIQAQRNFRRLVGANLSSSPLLISLTYKENMENITTAYKDHKSFIQALRYEFGKDIKYIAVPEFQKRGAVHFHSLFWGLPREVFLKEKETRHIAEMWGHGFIDVIETDGHGKISSYLAKYMAKAFTDRRLRNQKAYATSRNVTRPVVEKDGLILPLLYAHVEENALPIIDSRYNTKWLGNCHYRHFAKTKNLGL